MTARKFNDLMLGILPIEAATIWVISWPLIRRDWTVIFAPLLATAGAVAFWAAWYRIYARGTGEGTL